MGLSTTLASQNNQEAEADSVNRKGDIVRGIKIKLKLRGHGTVIRIEGNKRKKNLSIPRKAYARLAG
jgi:hypothetical protein